MTDENDAPVEETEPRLNKKKAKLAAIRERHAAEREELAAIQADELVAAAGEHDEAAEDLEEAANVLGREVSEEEAASLQPAVVVDSQGNEMPAGPDGIPVLTDQGTPAPGTSDSPVVNPVDPDVEPNGTNDNGDPANAAGPGPDVPISSDGIPEPVPADQAAAAPVAEETPEQAQDAAEASATAIPPAGDITIGATDDVPPAGDPADGGVSDSPLRPGDADLAEPVSQAVPAEGQDDADLTQSLIDGEAASAEFLATQPLGDDANSTPVTAATDEQIAEGAADAPSS